MGGKEGMGATGPSAPHRTVLQNLPLGAESHLSARASWASEENQSPLAGPLGMQIGARGEVGSSPLILLSWISKGIFPVL